MPRLHLGQRIEAALDRLQVAARDADTMAADKVTVNLADLIVALEEMDRAGIIDLDFD